MPMGMAEAAAVLWREFLTVDPSDPHFVDRDRFVLSAGHGSMLIYSLLHLAGFDLPMGELKRFRQLHSKTPGHPEYGLTPGVETTTGPLGQGFANAVGFALAERLLAARFNQPGFTLVDHYTWVICSDGDLHEGISHEAANIAGHLKLGKLIYLFDDNGITIDGSTALSTSEDVTKRFESYAWHVVACDGHDPDSVRQALEAARQERTRPTLIRCKTRIGHGSPNKEGSEKSHGSPLGEDEVALTKKGMGWPEDAHFHVPPEAIEAFEDLRQRGAAKRAAWQEMFARYARELPELAAEWERVMERGGDGLPSDIETHLPSFGPETKKATRALSGAVLNALAPHLPQLVGGSADLTGSVKTHLSDAGTLSADAPGHNIHYGVREHGMAGVMNGMALHGGVIPFGGTFLTFSDYMRGSMRLSALMGVRVVYVLTHESIFLGEDGPTHQAVEHHAALRVIPNMRVLRPADGNETAAAWLAALRRTGGPTSLCLTRQGLPTVTTREAALEGVARGGYVVRDAEGPPHIVLIGTGSELHLCTEAAARLAADGVGVRVVSMPSRELFLAQDQAYRDEVLPPDCPLRLSVEAASTAGWAAVVGPLGASLGIDRFGESAPAEDLAKFFGFTTDQVEQQARGMLSTFAARAREAAAELTAAAERIEGLSR